MTLKIVIATPYKHSGKTQLTENEIVVALSLDRNWYSPDQAKRVVDVAVGEGLLSRTDEAVVPTFDPASVQIPDEFTPDEGILAERSIFERMLDSVVSDDISKQTAVAEINHLQRTNEVTIEAAAAMYAVRLDVDVADEIAVARATLYASDTP